MAYFSNVFSKVHGSAGRFGWKCLKMDSKLCRDVCGIVFSIAHCASCERKQGLSGFSSHPLSESDETELQLLDLSLQLSISILPPVANNFLSANLRAVHRTHNPVVRLTASNSCLLIYSLLILFDNVAFNWWIMWISHKWLFTGKHCASLLQTLE